MVFAGEQGIGEDRPVLETLAKVLIEQEVVERDALTALLAAQITA